MPVFTLTSRRKARLAALAERVLEVPDLAGLTRLLTVELRQALSAEKASLLLWDRRLESFESLALDEAGRLRRLRPQGESPASPRTRAVGWDPTTASRASGTRAWTRGSTSATNQQAASSFGGWPKPATKMISRHAGARRGKPKRVKQ